VSLFGFGGGLVWARRLAVEQRRWLSEAEFLDIVSLCQFLPGPNVIGIAVCTGAKLRGLPGALAAIAGFLVLPWCAGLVLGVVCLRYAHNPILHPISAAYRRRRPVFSLQPGSGCCCRIAAGRLLLASRC
jgi:chromate transporter